MTSPRVFGPVLLLLTAGVSLWYADRGLPNPDEGAVLTAAARIARGAVFYRDLDAYWMPAAPYALALASSLFGETLAVARALAAALFCATVLSLYATALALLDRTRAALFALSLLSLKFFAWPAFTAYLYSDFAFAFACIAIALLVGPGAFGAGGIGSGDRSRVWLALAGACVGIAFASKQSVGIYLGGAVSLGLLRDPERRRELPAFAAGAACVALPIFLYFALHGVFGALVESALLRPFTSYLGTSAIPFHVPLLWWELGELRGNDAIPYLPHRLWHMLMQGQLPGWDHYLAYWAAAEVAARAVYTSLPIAFGWALWRWLRARREASAADARLFGFAWLAFAVAASAFPRADWFHVASVYPLVLLLLFALARTGRPPRIAAVWVVAVLALAGSLSAQYHAQLRYRLEIPRAQLWINPSDAWIEPLVAGVAAELAEGDPFFVYGHEAHYYFLAGRFSPWRFSQLYPGQTGNGGSDVAAALENASPRLVVRGLWSRWTGVPELRTYAPALEELVAARYRRDRDFFAERAPPAGHVPPAWVVSVLRPSEPAGEVSGTETPRDPAE